MKSKRRALSVGQLRMKSLKSFLVLKMFLMKMFLIMKMFLMMKMMMMMMSECCAPMHARRCREHEC